MDFKITTDSCSDIPVSYFEENNISYISLTANFKGRTIRDGFIDLSPAEFYNALREGEMPTTSQIPPAVMEEFLRNELKTTDKILHIGFSSGLSGTFSSAMIARNTLLEEEEFKNKTIELIDSKNATLGEGLLVLEAIEMQKDGYSFEEITERIKKLVPKVNSFFTVEDLQALKRGGRISSLAASVGGILSIKPVLNVDENGKLAARSKAKGRRKAINSLVEYTKQMYNPEESEKAYITHADSIEDANTLRDLLLKETNLKDISIYNLGAVIGSHTGAGCLSVHFIGKEKDDLKIL